MSNNYFLKAKSLLIAGGMVMGGLVSAQVQLNQLSGFGTAIMDINSQGHGLHSGGYYDFTTNSSSGIESDAVRVSAINDLEQVVGYMSNGSLGVRLDGVWTPFPISLTEDDTLYDISENGIWVVGQTTWDPATDTAWGFIYNTETNELRLFDDPAYEYSAAYGVNNDGYAVGWVDDLPSGTFRMPAIFNPDGTTTVIEENIGSMSGINDNGLAVGELEGQAIIYDVANASLQSFTAPASHYAVTFTSISNTDVAVGYAEAPGFSRSPVIYHSFLGNQPRLITDVLANFGISGSDLGGTAYRISTDGNYVAGFTDGPAFMASGWAIYFDDKLLTESECTLICPENISVTVENGESTAIVNYELSFECIDEVPEGLEIVLVNGLPSGSEFPIGTTSVYHELRDADGNVISACAFTVEVIDTYCAASFEGVAEPITYVSFEEIDNETSADSTAPNEFFLDMIANVSQGQTYPIAVEGYTGDGYVNYVNVFIDWNQDGEFDTETELYHIGALFNSNGMDGQQVTADIQVPNDALTGLTRMRVIKNYNANPIQACGEYFYGQTEDYSIMVEEGTPAEEDDCGKETPGNNFQTGLGPIDQYIFANDFEVQAGESFTIEQVKLNLWIEPLAEINAGDIYLYADSDGNGPGEELIAFTGLTPSSIKNVGGNFGFITYEVTFDINPFELIAEEENTTFWVGAQIESTAQMVYLDANQTLNTSYEQYIFDPDDLIWVTNTSVFEYEADGVLKLEGECATLGSNELMASDFSYYPNPVTDILNINSQKAVNSVEIFNLTGQKVQNNAKVQNGQINMSALNSGLYVIRVTLENGVIETFKVIKK